MNIKEVRDGLQFTIDMFLLDPIRNETLPEPRNELDKITVDACKGALELIGLEDNKNWLDEPSDKLTLVQAREAVKALRAASINTQEAINNVAQIAKVFARSDAQKALCGRIIFMLDHMGK